MLLFSSLRLLKGFSSFPMGWKSSRGWLCRRLCFLFFAVFSFFSKQTTLSHFKITSIKCADFSASSHLDLTVVFVKM